MRWAPLKARIRDTMILTIGNGRMLTGAKKGGRIIALHEIREPSVFKDKMGWLKQVYEILPLSQLLNNPNQQRLQVAITFDDGESSWHEAALPILLELGIPAVFFTCSGFVGLDRVKAVDFSEQCLRRQQELRPLSISQLKEIAGHSLFEIGGHTIHHVDLGAVQDEKVIRREILDDQKRLEDWTGKKVEWFAYPFGSKRNVSEWAKRTLRESTFKGAFTIIPAFVSKARSAYDIGRDCLELSDSDKLWNAWLNGGYDFRSSLFNR